jgi:hypothetical protein
MTKEFKESSRGPGDQAAIERRLRARIEGWLAAHDPEMLQRLRRHRYGSMALDEGVTAVSQSLRRAEVVRADPASADPLEGDEVLLDYTDRPGGLETVLVETLAADRDFWEGKLRWLPLPAEMPADPTAEDPGT